MSPPTATSSSISPQKSDAGSSSVVSLSRKSGVKAIPPATESEDVKVQDISSPSISSRGEGESSLLPPPDFLIPDSHDDGPLQLPKWQPSALLKQSDELRSRKSSTTATSPTLSEREDSDNQIFAPIIPPGVPLQVIAVPEDQVLGVAEALPVLTLPLSPRLAKVLPDTTIDAAVQGTLGRRARSGSTGSKSGRSRAGSLSRDEGSAKEREKAPPVIHRSQLGAQRTYSTPANIRRTKSTPRVILNGNSYITASAVPIVAVSTSKDKGLSAGSSQTQNGGAESKASKDAPVTAPLSLGDYLYLSLSTTPATKYDLVSAELRIQKIMNFLTLPIYLEGALWFGSFACLDGWLWNFTILPIRFAMALWLLLLYWMKLIGEMIATFAKAWLRPGNIQLEAQIKSSTDDQQPETKKEQKRRKLAALAKRRKTSDLQPNHKADLLKGALVIFSCWILMEFDASRMYHSIRGQNAIKLYVIYSVLEVADKLLAAIGQDIFECLLSRESLERRPDGTSKVLRPLGFFLLALGYNVLHAMALFYQVITLNVAVNSYSNSLITLLLSNQFVEIKTTVFKRIEKENLFQMACADIVERFQLWLMLIIIASRNLVEIGLEGLLGVGGFGLTGLVSAAGLGLGPQTTASVPNASTTSSSGGMVLPQSFTILVLPKWMGQIMGPFLLVLGSEMLVDWLKHAYITKFNNIKPQIYSRYLDVLAKDYYTNAFVEESLMRRLGLPVIPLACLFIRSSLQTYQMFISTHFPPPLATSTSFADHASSPATTAALNEFDSVFRRAFLHGSSNATDILNKFAEYLTIATIFIGIWLLFLAFKFVLGITLLGFARRRYKGMKEREKANFTVPGTGTGGMAEMNEEKKKWIHMGDTDVVPSGGGGAKKTTPMADVARYDMVAKRIW